MADQILLVPNKQSGQTLLQSYRLKHGLEAPTEGQVVKKFQVGAAPGDYSFILAKQPTTGAIHGMGGRMPLDQWLGIVRSRWTGPGGARGAENYSTGLQNAIRTVREAARTYSKGKGFTIVNGLVYTNWQAHLKTKATHYKSVTPIRQSATVPA